MTLVIGSSQKIIIDRTKNTAHPKYKDYIYLLDYDFLEGTVSSDEAGIDVWIGSSKEKKFLELLVLLILLKEILK